MARGGVKIAAAARPTRVAVGPPRARVILPFGFCLSEGRTGDVPSRGSLRENGGTTAPSGPFRRDPKEEFKIRACPVSSVCTVSVWARSTAPARRHHAQAPWPERFS